MQSQVIRGIVRDSQGQRLTLERPKVHLTTETRYDRRQGSIQERQRHKKVPLSSVIQSAPAQNVHPLRRSVGRSVTEHARLRGPYTNDISQIFGIFDPPSPLVSILGQYIVLKSRNLPYCISIWVTPLPHR